MIMGTVKIFLISDCLKEFSAQYKRKIRAVVCLVALEYLLVYSLFCITYIYSLYIQLFKMLENN